MFPLDDDRAAHPRRAEFTPSLAGFISAWCLQLVISGASVLATFVCLASVGPGYVTGSHDVWFAGWVSTAVTAVLLLAGSLAVAIFRWRAKRSIWWPPLAGGLTTALVALGWFVAAI